MEDKSNSEECAFCTQKKFRAVQGMNLCRDHWDLLAKYAEKHQKTLKYDPTDPEAENSFWGLE